MRQNIISREKLMAGTGIVKVRKTRKDKGTTAAKKRMAAVRAQNPHFYEKGSEEAKEYMAAVRAAKSLKTKPTKKGGHTAALEGDGFFDDIWDGVKSVGRVVAPAIKEVLPYVAPIAIKALTGGGSRSLSRTSASRVRRRGGSIRSLSRMSMSRGGAIRRSVSRTRAQGRGLFLPGSSVGH